MRYGELSAPLTAPPRAAAGRAGWLAVGLLAGGAGLVALAARGSSGAGPAGAAPQAAGPAAASLFFKDTVGGPGSPLAKQVVVGMDTNVNLHVAWNDWKDWSVVMAPYWAEDMIYDFNYVGPWDFGPTHGLKAWYEAEHLHCNHALPDTQWTDFIRAGTDSTCTSASYGLARWTGEFAGVPPPPGGPWVRVHDLDFYLIEGRRIKINWCLIDVVNLFEQVGYAVLPPAPMAMDGYRAPNAMDGYPAPLSSAVRPEDTRRSERVWRAALEEDLVRNAGGARWWAEDMVWYGPGGVGTAHSRLEYVTHFLGPLHRGFSNVSLALDLLLCEGKYCGAHFYLHATHTGPWLGEAATGRRVRIRCGAHAHLEGGRLVEGWLIIDVARAFADMGVDLYARARAMALARAAAGLTAAAGNASGGRPGA